MAAIRIHFMLSWLLTCITLCLVIDDCHSSSQREIGDFDVRDYYELIDHNIAKRDADKVITKKSSIIKKPTDPPKGDGKQKLMPVKTTPHADNASSTSTTTSTTEEPDIFDPENATEPPDAKEDTHQYYNSTFYEKPDEAMHFWVNMSALKGDIIKHDMLSSSHRRAATVNLKFDFPFYGHPMKNVTIATGGFLYLGEHVHSWLAATQYIAPLMANFDTSLSNDSAIQYADNGTAFIIQWNNVMLQDHHSEATFSFQVTLLKNGDIVFVYKDIPVIIAELPDTKHPVKVGISDAYVIDRTVFFIRRKTIYEYHRAELKKDKISNKTAIYFTAVQTCVSLTDCESCLTTTLNFDCSWCDEAKRCSTGFDRHRQDWLTLNCDQTSKPPSCSGNVTLANSTHVVDPAVPGESRKEHSNSAEHIRYTSDAATEESRKSFGFVSIVMIVSLVLGLTFWIFYAYKNPQSSSGQFLIRYRPAQWRWASSEARYTAASIHM